MNTKQLKRIAQLKKEKNAIILAHNYEPPEIQDAADIIGDSLELAVKAQSVTEDIIVLCGGSGSWRRRQRCSIRQRP